MRGFEDLEFGPHPASWGFDGQATMKFENGYGISVIHGEFAKGGPGTYEIAVLSGKWQSLDYSTPITDDVIGGLSPDEVTTVMHEIQKLPGGRT